MRRVAFVLRSLPYAAFFLLVLLPVGLVAYALAAVARTAAVNWRSGWNDHD